MSEPIDETSPVEPIDMPDGELITDANGDELERGMDTDDQADQQERG